MSVTREQLILTGRAAALIALVGCSSTTDAAHPPEADTPASASPNASAAATPSAAPRASNPESDALAFIVANELAVNRILAARLADGIEGAARALSAEKDVLSTRWRAIADLKGAALSSGTMRALRASVTDGAKDVCMLGDERLCNDYVALFD